MAKHRVLPIRLAGPPAQDVVLLPGRISGECATVYKAQAHGGAKCYREIEKLEQMPIYPERADRAENREIRKVIDYMSARHALAASK